MSKMRKLFKGGENGFTLIELLVVIAVLGILAGIAIPRLGGVTDKAEDAAIGSFAGAVRTGMEMYAVEHDGNYPDMSGYATDLSPLATDLDTVTDDDTMADYNIDSITYADNSSDLSQYLITFTGSAGTYYLGELGYSDTQAEATSP